MEMNEIMRMFEVTLYEKLCKDSGADIPEEVHDLVKCLVLAGCPMKCVLKGMTDFGEKMTEKEDRENLKELLKGLPIKWEDD